MGLAVVVLRLLATRSTKDAGISPCCGAEHSFKIGGQYHYRKFYTNTANPMDGDADLQRCDHWLPNG